MLQFLFDSGEVPLDVLDILVQLLHIDTMDVPLVQGLFVLHFGDGVGLLALENGSPVLDFQVFVVVVRVVEVLDLLVDVVNLADQLPVEPVEFLLRRRLVQVLFAVDVLELQIRGIQKVQFGIWGGC